MGLKMFWMWPLGLSTVYHEARQIIATSHDFTPRGSFFGRGNLRKFQGNLGPWNIIPFGQMNTLQGTNISPQNGILKMMFLFPRWDMLIPWRVSLLCYPLQRSDGQRVEVTDDRTGKLISLPHPVKELRVSWRPTKTWSSFVSTIFGWKQLMWWCVYIYTYDHICKYKIIDISFYIHIIYCT